MKQLCYVSALFACLALQCRPALAQKIFDVHVHGTQDAAAQMQALQMGGVYKAAISTSWDLQNSYRDISKIDLLYGLMFPCPNGKVPYSLQPCFDEGHDWPAVAWVEAQIRQGRIDYFGELLSQYYGISSSDTLLFPYYRLAEQYNLPVGIHTGGAGPGHGSPNFKPELGNPLLLTSMLSHFPSLKVWIMHSGDQAYKETINIMRAHQQVYADISVISNPDIVPFNAFADIMKAMLDAGLEDRLMFGTDNGDIAKVVRSVEALPFLSKEQKEKLYYRNAERFFSRSKKR